MKTCTFFGHRQIWENIDGALTELLADLIEKQGITNFYVGNQGDFDKIVIRVLKSLRKRYSTIYYTVVLAYLPKRSLYYADTIYPEGLEEVPPKYAIIKRNQWMIEQSDVVVTYINYPVGGAMKARIYAEKLGKRIINIYKGENT